MSLPILFLDFNGVLSYNRFWRKLEDETHEYHPQWKQLQKYLFIDNKILVQQWMLGGFTSEEIHKEIEDKIGIPFDYLFPLFIEGCKTIDISELILTEINRLQGSYYRILATGNMDSLERFTLPNNPQIERAFDQIDNSFRIKKLKDANNGEYFLQRSVEKNVPITSCILIDDSERTCEIFNALGGTAYCVTGEQVVLDVLRLL